MAHKKGRPTMKRVMIIVWKWVGIKERKTFSIENDDSSKLICLQQEKFKTKIGKISLNKLNRVIKDLLKGKKKIQILVFLHQSFGFGSMHITDIISKSSDNNLKAYLFTGDSQGHNTYIYYADEHGLLDSSGNLMNGTSAGKIVTVLASKNKIKKKYFEDYFYQTTKRKGIGIFLVDYELLKVFDIKLDKKEIYSASWENLEKIIFSKNQRKIQSDLILHFNKQYIKLICKMNGTLKY